jgi:hypothetical protein
LRIGAYHRPDPWLQAGRIMKILLDQDLSRSIPREEHSDMQLSDTHDISPERPAVHPPCPHSMSP